MGGSHLENHHGNWHYGFNAIKSLTLQVEEMLGMRSPIAIVCSPDKPNLKLSSVEMWYKRIWCNNFYLMPFLRN